MWQKRTITFTLLIFCSISGITNSEDLFVEETGETDFIPIESEPSEVRIKREAQAVDYSYSYADDYDENAEGKIIAKFITQFSQCAQIGTLEDFQLR